MTFICRVKKRTLALALALGMAALGGSGCAIEHLTDNTGKNFESILRQQIAIRLTDLDAPQNMSAEDAEVVRANLELDRKKTNTNTAGGSKLMSLVR